MSPFIDKSFSIGTSSCRQTMMRDLHTSHTPAKRAPVGNARKLPQMGSMVHESIGPPRG
jgi:hypothetical protein